MKLFSFPLWWWLLVTLVVAVPNKVLIWAKTGNEGVSEDCETAVEDAVQAERDRVAAEQQQSYTCPAHSVAQFDLPCPVPGGGIPKGEEALVGKPGTRVLPALGKEPDPAACPQNAEGRVELLTTQITPYENFYVRNNGQIPARAQSMEINDDDDDDWTLTIDGLVDNPRTFTMAELQEEFPVYTRQHFMMCAGQGRHGYRPALPGLGGPGDGNQWTIGAVGNAEWTGVLLRDVLEAVGLQDDATDLAWFSEDLPCSEPAGNAVGDNDAVISRGFPLEKALDGYTMLAWGMNGETLPAVHGFPLRLVVPGYLGAASGKWIRRLWIRDQEHDGKKMTGWTYRMPVRRYFPGSVTSKIPIDEYDPPIETVTVTTLPVYSIITTPPRCHTTDSTTVSMEGKTMSGIGDVAAVELSYDSGLTWIVASNISTPVNKWAWQTWSHTLQLPQPGQYQIIARATDAEGRMQPLIAANWNPKGYLNNAVMSVDVTVTD